MNKFLVSTILSTVLASAFTIPAAHAKEIQLSGTHSINEIRGACAGAGGTMVVSSGRYGCVNNSKGTQVICTPGGQCTGTVPGRTNPSGGSPKAGSPIGAASLKGDLKMPTKVNDARASMPSFGKGRH